MPLNLPDPPRILVTRTDRIGDLVLTTPLFKALREKFPKGHLAVLVFLEHREIVEGNPFLDEVILYDKKGSERGLVGQFRFSQKLRKKKFDMVIHAHGTNRMHLAGWLAGIPVRVGYARRAPWALTHVHPYDKKEGERHEAEYLFNLLEPLGIARPGKIEPCFPVTEQGERLLESVLAGMNISSDQSHSRSKEFNVNGTSSGNLLRKENGGQDRPWIVLSPSASDVTKMWPAERFAELVTRLDKERSSFFLAIGTAKDQAILQSLKQKTQVPVVDLGGKLSLGMLGALLKKSALLVTNDSGPAHIGAAVGCPVVSIFGRYEPGLGPQRWRPLGDKCRVVAKDVSSVLPEERKFTYIEEIPVEAVLAAARELFT
jgi:heptosyltransferase-2